MESIETLKKKLAECQKDGKEKVEILNQLSQNYLDKSPDKGLEYGKQALELSEQLNNKKERANSLYNIGEIYKSLCDYNKALQYHLKALKIYEKIIDKKGAANCLNNIGIIHRYLSTYDKALEYCQKSLKIYEEIEDKKGIASALFSVGLIYWNLSNYDKALEYYMESLKIYEEIEDKKGIALSLNNIGLIYYDLSNYDKALEYYLKSLRILEEIEDKNGIANTLENIALINSKLSNYNRAIEFHFKSLKIFKEIEDKIGIASSLTNIGDLYLKLKNYSKAFTSLEQGLQLAKEIKAKHLIEKSYEVFSDLYIAKEDHKKALEYYKLYSKTKDSIFTEESSKKIAEMQTKYETEKKEKEAEIFRLKNVELVKANAAIQKKNEELNAHREHIKLINKILRHDIINNLAVIRSALNLYKKTNDKKVLEEASSRIDKSIELINAMRKLESFISAHQELKLYEITDVLKSIIEKYSTIDFNIKGIGKVLADDTLNSVIDNIIGNAVIHGKTEKIDIQVKEQTDLCELRIADYGIGIPDKIKKKIFDEDFIYGKTGHTGLGLFIVKKAMESYGGSVHVEDNQPKGTVFILKFRRVG